ncbi:MAG: SPASM domain-containing protein [Deltaproteobacteria bacterium]|nr:MAG: SPASM domain-containing protein [Deltaproteobacteria bacterium]
MGLDLLDTPVRLTWDLHGPGAAAGDAVLTAMADRIAAAGVFYVTLDQRPLVHPAVAAIVARLATGGCAVTVTCSGSEAELAALARLPAPLPAVQLDAGAFLADGLVDRPRLKQLLERLRGCGIEAALFLLPRKSNLHVIPSLLDFCRTAGVQRFKLPNARIGDTFESIPADDLPCWPDLAAFRELWARQAPEWPAALQLEIHDRFLWEIMTPGAEQARSEYGGCQAANSLGHVDAAGTVYACAAWPEPFGSLATTDLDVIWQSPRRLAVRARVAETPSGCLGCRDYAVCFGGCRGLGELLNSAGGGRDPMCRAPRR